MNVAQLAFAVGLVVVLVASTAFALVVIGSARRGGRARVLSVRGSAADFAQSGRVAFLAHRISGFAILAFLALHIADVGLYSFSHRLYNDVQSMYGSAPLRIFECGLLFAVLFHTGNGLRLIGLDLAPSRRWPSRLLPLVVGIAALGGVAGSAIILRPLFR